MSDSGIASSASGNNRPPTGEGLKTDDSLSGAENGGFQMERESANQPNVFTISSAAHQNCSCAESSNQEQTLSGQAGGMRAIQQESLSKSKPDKHIWKKKSATSSDENTLTQKLSNNLEMTSYNATVQPLSNSEHFRSSEFTSYSSDDDRDSVEVWDGTQASD